MKLVGDWFEDGMFNDVVSEDNSFKENEKSRKWYEGHSGVTLSYDGKLGRTYEMETTATSGHLSTPWFGEHFSAEKFKMGVSYNYNINFPTNLAAIAPNISLVVVMMVDTKETGGCCEWVSTLHRSSWWV